eukprot:1159054-Pelagomonas_calceolata.AAC.17
MSFTFPKALFKGGKAKCPLQEGYQHSGAAGEELRNQLLAEAAAAHTGAGPANARPHVEVTYTTRRGGLRREGQGGQAAGAAAGAPAQTAANQGASTRVCACVCVRVRACMYKLCNRYRTLNETAPSNSPVPKTNIQMIFCQQRNRCGPTGSAHMCPAATRSGSPDPALAKPPAPPGTPSHLHAAHQHAPTAAAGCVCAHPLPGCHEHVGGDGSCREHAGGDGGCHGRKGRAVNADQSRLCRQRGWCASVMGM